MSPLNLAPSINFEGLSREVHYERFWKHRFIKIWKPGALPLIKAVCNASLLKKGDKCLVVHRGNHLPPAITALPPLHANLNSMFSFIKVATILERSMYRSGKCSETAAKWLFSQVLLFTAMCWVKWTTTREGTFVRVLSAFFQSCISRVVQCVCVWITHRPDTQLTFWRVIVAAIV